MYKKLNSIFKWGSGSIPIIAMFFGIFVYTTEYNLEIKDWLDKKHEINLSILMYILIGTIFFEVIFLLGILVTNSFLKLNERSIDLEKENFSLKERLANQITLTISRNSKEQIIDIIDIFLSNFSKVISVQIYECKSYRKGQRHFYEIKPTLYYKTREGEVANLIHERYCIPSALIDQFESVKAKFDKGDTVSMETYIANMHKELKKELNSRNRVNEINLYKYSLLLLAMQYYINGVSFKVDDIDENIIKQLNEIKRTGFLRGLLHGKYYKFIKDGKSHKEGRIYITRCIDIQSKKHMVVIILNPIEIKDGLGDYLDKVGEKFYELLSTRTSLIYNDFEEKEA